jgi:hypothetical protein
LRKSRNNLDKKNDKMITEEDKERIKSEEIFREEIRKALMEKERASFRKISWNFFNSPFGLWLLSTVLVGLTVYFYNDSKLRNEISANNSATIQKLETETSNRLQQFKAEYQEKEKIFEQGKLSEYHNGIKMKLDDLLSLFQSNPYLKSLSDK